MELLEENLSVFMEKGKYTVVIKSGSSDNEIYRGSASSINSLLSEHLWPYRDLCREEGKSAIWNVDCRGIPNREAEHLQSLVKTHNIKVRQKPA